MFTGPSCGAWLAENKGARGAVNLSQYGCFEGFIAFRLVGGDSALMEERFKGMEMRQRIHWKETPTTLSLQRKAVVVSG